MITSGSGGLKASVTRMLLTSEMYIVVRENKKTGAVEVFVKNIDLKLRKERLKVEMDNISGGGFVGSGNKVVASKIVRLLGEDFINSSKDIINQKLRELFSKELLKIIGLDS